MTVSTSTSSALFLTGGTVFPLPFRFFDNADIQVMRIDATTGAVTPQVLGVDYSLTGAGEPELDGGPVSELTLSVALQVGTHLFAARVLAVTQEIDIVNQGKFFADVHEDAFDRIVMLIQQVSTSLGKVIRVPDSDPNPALLPPAAQRAGFLMAFDSLGNPITVAPVAGSASALALALADATIPSQGAAMIGRGIQVVPSLAALRALQKTQPSKSAFVLDYGHGLGGGGLYQLDPLDVVTADNDGTYVVGADGGRWKMPRSQWANGLDVRIFGAKPDDQSMTGSDSTTALVAARNFAVANGIGKLYAPGFYRMHTASLNVDTALYTQSLWLEGDGPLTSRIRQTGNNLDVVKFSSVQFMRNSGIRNIELMAMANAGHGVNIVYGCTLCAFDNVNVIALNPAKKCYIGDWSGLALGDGGVFDTVWRGGDLYTDPGSTTFAIEFITNGTCFNENLFDNMRWNGGGISPFFHAINTHGASYLVNNRFRNINCEQLKGGGFAVSSARGWSWDGISFWDASAGYDNHLLQIVNNGLQSVSCSIRNMQRNGDSLNVGADDIHVEAGAITNLAVDSCSFLGGRVDYGDCVVTETNSTITTRNNTKLAAIPDWNRVSMNGGRFVGATAVASYAHGVGSIVRLSAGLYRVTFTEQKLTVDYRTYISVGDAVACWTNAIQATTHVDIQITRFDSTAFDPAFVGFDVFG